MKSRRWFFWKNVLLADALQKRVEKVIYLTLLTMTLEIHNPFDRKRLLYFLEKKLSLLHRLVKLTEFVNGRRVNHYDIAVHIGVFHRNSLMQAHIIKVMHRAVQKSGRPPIIVEAEEGLKKGLQPILATLGGSGAYWMRNTHREVLGLFKPFDEEIFSPNNPVGPKFQGAVGSRRLRRGCRSGESPHHEVGAFLVDEFFGFGIVPRTYYASFEHQTFFLAREDRLKRKSIKKKYGSFQEYVGGFVPLTKLKKVELTTIPLDEFQLLVVLDVITGNCDRNIGNILFGDEKIAAIDNGLCFPDYLDSLSYWYWSMFEQGKNPLLKPILELMNNFPLEELSHRLRKRCFIPLMALQRMGERIALFRVAINSGLVPAQIKDLMTAKYLFPLKNDPDLSLRAEEQLQVYKQETL